MLLLTQQNSFGRNGFWNKFKVNRRSVHFALKWKRKHKNHRFAFSYTIIIILSGTRVRRGRHIKSPSFRVAFSHVSKLFLFLCTCSNRGRISQLCGSYVSEKAHFSFIFFLYFWSFSKMSTMAWGVKCPVPWRGFVSSKYPERIHFYVPFWDNWTLLLDFLSV